MKKSGPALKQELGDTSYLEAHPKVCKLFQEVGCYKFCEKIQGFHQQVAKDFSLSFDVSKAVKGKEEFLIDETLVSEVTELPSTSEKWFKKLSVAVKYRNQFLENKYQDVDWSKGVPREWIKKKWK